MQSKTEQLIGTPSWSWLELRSKLKNSSTNSFNQFLIRLLLSFGLWKDNERHHPSSLRHQVLHLFGHVSMSSIQHVKSMIGESFWDSEPVLSIRL